MQTLVHSNVRSGEIALGATYVAAEQACHSQERTECFSDDVFNGKKVIVGMPQQGSDETTVKELRDALRKVGLLEEVLTLPDGLNTLLQTDGAPLTQSQAARLMLARAIVGRPRLLLIDGALDGLPDGDLQLVLAELLTDAPWTALVATGRREVADACDREILLEGPGASSKKRRTEV